MPKYSVSKPIIPVFIVQPNKPIPELRRKSQYSIWKPPDIAYLTIATIVTVIIAPQIFAKVNNANVFFTVNFKFFFMFWWL